MDFPNVSLVVQYRVRDLTLVKWEQRRGRGARREGMTAVGVVLVEKSMTGDDGKLSVTSPGSEDPALLDYIHTETCHIEVSDVWLENPPRNTDFFAPPPCQGCSKCNPRLRVSPELVWIMETAPLPTSLTPRTPMPDPTEQQKKEILTALKGWRVKLWRDEWSDEWPSYGPHSLISDADLEIIAQRAHTIHTYDDIYSLTQILHIDDLAAPLLAALESILIQVCGHAFKTTATVTVEPAVDFSAAVMTPQEFPTFTSLQWVEPENSETMGVPRTLNRKRTIDNLSGI